MADVRRGNVARLAELFERHHRRLHGFFARLTGDRGAAEDLVQEVFVRVLKYRRSYRAEAPFLPWLFALARNAASDHARRRVEPIGARADADLLTTDELPAEERLAHEAATRRLDAALARLSPEKREALVLARFAELPYEHVGVILGVSVGAVKVRVHRAMSELRALYFDASKENGHDL